MTHQTNESTELIARLYSEVWNEGDGDVLAEIVSEDVSHRGNIVPDGLKGRDGYARFLESVLSGFPDTTVELITTIGDAESAASRWVAHGTHTQPYMDIEPTGKRVSTNGVTIASVENGQITEIWDLYDTFGLLTQLGVISAQF